MQQRLLQIRGNINDLTKLNLVPSKLNPADLATKTITPIDLSNCDL